MSSDYNMHFVCTNDEASRLIQEHEQFYVSNCGCRESKGGCARSRTDVCLYFVAGSQSSGSGKRRISKDEAAALVKEAKEHRLVTRPFRSENDKNVLDGICFCCDDCCFYFTAHREACDKGASIESTCMDDCVQCGNCVDACYFKARRLDSGALAVDSDKCYGCGLCADICPSSCISMVIK